MICSMEDKKILLHKMMEKESRLPKIRESDSIAKYLGLKPGELVKI